MTANPMVWLELTKADGVKTYINFSQVIEITPVVPREVTVVLFVGGFRTEVKEAPDAILRSLELGGM